MPAKTRLQQFEELLALMPDDAELRYSIAMEHASLGNHDRAVECFRDLFAVAPTYVPAYFQAGQLLARLGRPAEAIQVLRDGAATARRTNDLHALGEIEGLLATLE